MKYKLYDQRVRAAAARPIPAPLRLGNVELELENKLCGDRVSLQAQMDGEKYLSVRVDVDGCLLCRAAASLVSEKAAGLTHSAAADLLDSISAFMEGGSREILECWPELEMFLPLVDHVSRRKCVLLAFQALERAGQNHEVSN